VHLGIYEFDGEPNELLAAYDRMMRATANSTLAWHLCAVRPDGIVVYDTCPDGPTFERFSTSPEFLGAVRSAGLPEPRVTGLPVHAARGGQPSSA
jgi:hypothetical protein